MKDIHSQRLLQRPSGYDELERQGFETWFSGGNSMCRSIERSGDGYKLMTTQQAWIAWQACGAWIFPDT